MWRISQDVPYCFKTGKSSCELTSHLLGLKVQINCCFFSPPLLQWLNVVHFKQGMKAIYIYNNGDNLVYNSYFQPSNFALKPSAYTLTLAASRDRMLHYMTAITYLNPFGASVPLIKASIPISGSLRDRDEACIVPLSLLYLCQHLFHYHNPLLLSGGLLTFSLGLARRLS